jgi:oxygen-independent coproporphyrinogen-3 oxidase
MNTPALERHFARTGVDPLTAAFGDEPAPARPSHTQRPPPAPDTAAIERAAALKAAMPAHALRIFESWQASPEHSPARAAIETTLPPHALRALKTLSAALRETRAAVPGSPPLPDWSDLAALPGGHNDPARPFAVYAHFPFCAARCGFCPFYRYADPADWRPYRDSLLREIDLAAAPFSPPISPAAVYFGGGTPSDLPSEALVALIDKIRSRFALSPGVETTVEGRPATLDPEKVAALRDAGVNRFSLGVQTFDGALRQAMGRKLGETDLLPRLRAIARAAGDAPVIIDLIYGLPGQTDAAWEHDLELAIREEAVAGLDLYRLKVFPGSPLARLAASGHAAPADDAVMARRFARGVARLEAAGFRRLSRWHWARRDSERSAYNRLAKGAGDIIPLGCGAGGRWNRHDFINTPDLPSWTEAIRSGRKPCAGRGAPAEPWREILSAQIEACRLTPSAWPGALPDARAAAESLLDQWNAAGLLARDGPDHPLTLAGQYWSDRLLHSLQTVLEASAPR